MGLATPARAIATALAEAEHPSESYYERCDHFVGVCYGLAHSGYPSAAAHWAAIPRSRKHEGDPPAGAVVYWDIGRFGHTALVVAPGTIASNDIVTKGRISVVRLGRIAEGWGARYLGWADPYFGGRHIDLSSSAPAPPAMRTAGTAGTGAAQRPTVSLSAIREAATLDPPAPQGHLTDLKGTLLVERALAAEGLLDPRFVDGSFGRRTVAAYAVWQERLKFRGTSADGIPGIKTLTALGFRHDFTVVR